MVNVFEDHPIMRQAISLKCVCQPRPRNRSGISAVATVIRWYHLRYTFRNSKDLVLGVLCQIDGRAARMALALASFGEEAV
jgi:hypothetical protein